MSRKIKVTAHSTNMVDTGSKHSVVPRTDPKEVVPCVKLTLYSIYICVNAHWLRPLISCETPPPYERKVRGNLVYLCM